MILIIDMILINVKAPPDGGGAYSDRQRHLDDTAPVSLGAVDVKIAILLDEIGCAIGPIEAQLNCLAAMVTAGDSAGASLRRLKAIWYGLLTARDLIAADAERLSAIRQAGEP